MDKPFNADDITLVNWEGIKQYRSKPVIVKALQMNFPEGFTVASGKLVSLGKQGDYLVFDNEGNKYFYSKEAFERDYELIKDFQLEEVD